MIAISTRLTHLTRSLAIIAAEQETVSSNERVVMSTEKEKGCKSCPKLTLDFFLRIEDDDTSSQWPRCSIAQWAGVLGMRGQLLNYMLHAEWANKTTKVGTTAKRRFSSCSHAPSPKNNCCVLRPPLLWRPSDCCRPFHTTAY